MRFKLIDEEKAHHSISRIAGVLGASRAGYHMGNAVQGCSCAILVRDSRRGVGEESRS